MNYITNYGLYLETRDTGSIVRFAMQLDLLELEIIDFGSSTVTRDNEEEVSCSKTSEVVWSNVLKKWFVIKNLDFHITLKGRGLFYDWFNFQKAPRWKKLVTKMHQMLQRGKQFYVSLDTNWVKMVKRAHWKSEQNSLILTIWVLFSMLLNNSQNIKKKL